MTSALVFLLGNKRSDGELVLPKCTLNNTVSTSITFFVDEKIKQSASIDVVNERILDAINYSNLVLSNSCVPMTRTLEKIEWVKLPDQSAVDSDTLHLQLLDVVGEARINQMRRDKTAYYGLVLEKQHNYVLGNVAASEHVNFNGSFFILAENAALNTLEHELGHIAWAMHADTKPVASLDKWVKSKIPREHHHKIKAYAKGFSCKGAGTVMSFSEVSLPVYSSPDVQYDGEVCGDAKHGDNARQMKEYALSLMDKARI
ncbi:hypothetical protein [Vibrio sp. LaRot3]|uniref:hypothetical protein n=1 Tax=Vibrio sp. LaRot3 TaxID=2998829 RepID=UPI0022CDBDBD|nr:hypothetical protein [Vibrio sp. LaRot3]MDA0148406.1 hypothetical protein [Vibrio sp. LaRot3]